MVGLVAAVPYPPSPLLASAPAWRMVILPMQQTVETTMKRHDLYEAPTENPFRVLERLVEKVLGRWQCRTPECGFYNAADRDICRGCNLLHDDDA